MFNQIISCIGNAKTSLKNLLVGNADSLIHENTSVAISDERKSMCFYHLFNFFQSLRPDPL